MKVSTFRSEQRNGKIRTSASVTWEECDLPHRTLYFETDADLAGPMLEGAEPFLLACILPAWHRGETRLQIDAKVCPELLAGVRAAITLIDKWWPSRGTVRIETLGCSDYEAAKVTKSCDRAAGVFLSGGVDSLAALALNGRAFPADHPRAMKLGLFVHGFDLGIDENDNQLDRYARACDGLDAVCRDRGIELIPVSTNVRHLDPDGPFWGSQFHGAALAAVGHAFANRLDSITIGSGDNIEMVPWGSHPALDSLYSGGALRVYHDGMQFNRLEKTALVAEWPAALNSLRVCHESVSGDLNCGRCEKCVRTMLHLLLCGKLAECTAFAPDDVSPDMIREFWHMPVNYNSYRTLLGPLSKIGRPDLVRAIENRLRASSNRAHAQRQLRDRARELDAHWFGGNLSSLWCALRGIRSEQAR